MLSTELSELRQLPYSCMNFCNKYYQEGKCTKFLYQCAEDYVQQDCTRTICGKFYDYLNLFQIIVYLVGLLTISIFLVYFGFKALVFIMRMIRNLVFLICSLIKYVNLLLRNRIVFLQMQLRKPTYNMLEEEAYLPSSPYVQLNESRRPKFAFYVYVHEPGTDTFDYFGMGFWVSQYFLTARHVIYKARPGQVIRLQCCRDESKVIDTVYEDWKIFDDEDVAYLKPSQTQTVQLGVSKGTPKNLDNKVTVSLFGKKMSSCGLLTRSYMCPVSQANYFGSSDGGFSGGPLYINNEIFAMHLGSSSEKGTAMLVSFILMRIHSEENGYREESSEDVLLDTMAEKFKRFGEKTYFSRSPFDTDEFWVSGGGKTFAISGDKFSKYFDMMAETAEDTILGWKARGSKFSPESLEYIDAETPSVAVAITPVVESKPKNLKAPSPVVEGAGVTLAEPAVLDQSQVLSELTQLRGLVMELANTVGLLSTRVQQGEVSHSIPESSSPSSRARRRRVVQASRNQSERLPDSSNPGPVRGPN